MNKLTVALFQSLVLAGILAAQTPAEEEKLKQDLTAVIALHGQPCGEVVAVQVLAESDYAASCKDGNKYRVYLNKEGRVVVEKQA
ncbi:MAG TPA: hypothetical protein VH701_03660 [Vicinamibacterales bacterium]|jgi:hypothetical protein